MIRLKELRVKKGLTQSQFAKELNLFVVKGTISNWEVGASEPDIATLIQIAKYFDVDLDYLIGVTDTPARTAAFHEAMTTIEDSILNSHELSDKSKVDMIKQLKTVKLRDKAKFHNETAKEFTTKPIPS
ncbi:MAG: helix-turn-helix domain-containing protein [Oscillospiraceae bacterium]|nr:helix-turn-helix domain-containing protein [Oscillospiraceae bacterium]